MLVGVGTYMARKRMKILSRVGLIKHWLEFHIFLCILGPIMVLFHTAFKFGGIVSISFWSMVAVALSGVLGRFIYLQIPRTVDGRQLDLQEVQTIRNNISNTIQNSFNLNKLQYESIQKISSGMNIKLSENGFLRTFQKMLLEWKFKSKVRILVHELDIPKENKKELLNLVKHEISITRRMDMLLTMQKIFRYWHVVHLPFAIVMLVIMIIHVAVTLAFGYQWIF